MFGKLKCKICGKKYSKNNDDLVRLDTKDGTIEINICPECAEYMDKCADHLMKKNTKNESV